MFARKAKASDLMGSLQRFTDMTRDSVSRVKHLKILLDSLSTQEKRQLIEEHSFETFHLVDELLLSADIVANPQGAVEGESGLWTLEQVLCFAPELVGSGWQRHAIEAILKKALYPRNLLAIRKIAIRLFLIFYQSLSIYGKVTEDLDRVFQCLLPYFPLSNGQNTELLLQEYCHSAGTTHWSDRSVSSPTMPGNPVSNAKERAQMLQVYLDKFLEYCTRESVRIEWSDEKKRFQCASFIIDRVINLYIAECFPDIEANGVDIFGGWEGADDTIEALDTADPIVIARYWLIRWVNNLAAVRQQPAAQWHPGMLLYHDALFASHRATNTALTLMREAMTLPLPCSNVIQKVVSTLSAWLLQYEIPPFVASNEVPVESSSLLLINMLLSFFQSPYLLQPGDRLQSAITTSYAVLRTCRDLVAYRHNLARPLTVRVWSELMYRLCQSAARVCSHSEKYAQEMSSAFAMTVLTNIVLIKAVRQIEIEDKLWDEVHIVFQRGIWIQMAHQWARLSQSVTRALILHLAHVDIFTQEDLDKANEKSISKKKSDVVENENADENSADNEANDDNSTFIDADDITNAVQTWSGNPTQWLQVWRRFMCLLGPHSVSSANAAIAVETLSNTINSLLGANLDPLAHWIAARLVQTPVNLLPNCIASLGSVLNSSRQPSPMLQAHILHAFMRLIKAGDSQVLPHLALMSPRHLMVLSQNLLQAIPAMISQNPPSSHCLKVLALLSSSSPSAEQMLLSQLSQPEISLTHALLCVNALSMLVIQRGDSELMSRMLALLQNHRCGPSLMPLLCSCLESLYKVAKNPNTLQIVLRTIPTLRDERLRTEVLWTIASLALSHSLKSELPQITRAFLVDQQKLLEGALLTMEGQFPLPGFNVSKWNSVEPTSTKTNETQVFVQRDSAIIGVAKDSQLEVTTRTVVGRHCWVLEPHKAERKEWRNVNAWLQKEAQRGRRAGGESVGILGAMDDPFDALPRQSNVVPSKAPPEWMAILEDSRRQPQPLKPLPPFAPKAAPSRLHEWRSFSASLGFVPSVSEVPLNFSRDLKHLDQTCAREVHKVAVIYVADGQEDKQSILSNTTASPCFERFVSELGWQVRIGRGHEGYPGGLPYDTEAPYYAAPDTELIFHVSTHLTGDATQKWKHIGNDEVHVVWSEHSKPYRRETIATKFCDVLIVLERADTKMYRVRVETVSALEFGPLYDGALVGSEELAELVRLTVINASRAYRLAHKNHVRPLRHREHVFAHDTMRHMKKVRLSDAINALYIPTMTA
uniref:Rap-GAP domain-containing protein n=1 Tax=Haemonchus contortus TaxID=6289 RepID=A0A7I4XYD0_HAECO